MEIFYAVLSAILGIPALALLALIYGDLDWILFRDDDHAK
jgi:hypothetical protein